MTVTDFGDLGFHTHDGWHFARLGDGSVRILSPDETGQAEHRVFCLDPDTWASVVASVSPAGGTSETYAAAQALHTGSRWQGPTVAGKE